MKASPLRYRRKARGFTLAEFMVAVTIGLIILAAVSSVYVSSGQTFRANDNLARVQENTRIAFDFMSRDIRQAGYSGCALQGSSISFNNVLNNSSNVLWDFYNPVYGYTATSSTAWNVTPDSVITSPLGGRDILVVRSLDEGGGSITAQGGSTGALTVDGQSGITAGDILLASNCTSTSVFEATAVTASGGNLAISHAAVASPAPGNSTNDLYVTFAGGDIRRVSTKIYYVGTGASGIPALFVRKSTDTAAQELVEGIDGMKIMYGVDTNSDAQADTFMSAADAETGGWWLSVVSVQITLQTISYENNVAVTAQSNALGTSTDKRLHQQMTTTISLRNKN